MLSAIPPLWRDIDAHGEVAHPPGPETILLHGPLYSFAARIPLYLGNAVGCLRSGRPLLPAFNFLIHPTLTDLGVLALLISQHIALCCATFYLIILISRVFWVRLVLAIAFAANPLLYTFAHTVGSEALSMVLLLLIAATGLKMVQAGKVPLNKWLIFGVVLWLSILTRHINAVLAALMPTVYILLAAYQFIAIPSTKSQAFRRWRWMNTKHALQKATLAVAVGLSSIVLVTGTVRGVCRAARMPYYSTAGVSFLYRLKFLTALPAEKREQLFDEVTKYTASTDVKSMISILRRSFPTEISNWNVGDFNHKAKALLFTRQTDPYDEKYALLLNRTARAFIYPPNEIFLRAVATDFKRSQQITIPDVVSFLFVTTRFYFSHRDAMAQCASLVTFRGKNADQVFAIFKKNSYFRHPKNLSYRALLLFWFIGFGCFVAIVRMCRQKATTLGSYAVALTAVALSMMLANCLLTVFQPRYTLPMWELTIISISILFGGIMDGLFSLSRRLHSPKAHEET